MPSMTLIVGTDGSAQTEIRVREAAMAARDRGASLHVVCSVPPLGKVEQRQLDRALPGDVAHLAGPQGQRYAAIADVRAMLGSTPGVDLHVTTSEQRLVKAERLAAERTGGQIYGTSTPSPTRRLLPRLRPRTA